MPSTMPIPDTTTSPELTDIPVVDPKLTAIKPSKTQKKYRPEKASLAKLNMDEAQVGEIDTSIAEEEEKTAGEFKMDVFAYLSGYCDKEAEDRPTGRAVTVGKEKIRLGSPLAREKRDVLLKKLRGGKKTTKDVMHAPTGGLAERLKSWGAKVGT